MMSHQVDEQTTGPTPAGGLTMRLDDAGVLIDADVRVADLLGSRVADLVGKPFVVFVGGPLRRSLFVALREVRAEGGRVDLHGELVSRDPVRIQASLILSPWSDGIEVAIRDIERVVDVDGLMHRLERVRERQRELADRLDAVTRPRPGALPDLDVGAEPVAAGGSDPGTTALHDWRLLPSGELFMLAVAGHGRQALHRQVVHTVREIVRAFVAAAGPPDELFARVERLGGFRGTGPLASAVAAYGAPDGSRALVVSAGAPPPLVRRADGSVEHLPVSGFALGAEQTSHRSSAKVALVGGDALVLRVDGGGGPGGVPASDRFERRLASLVPHELGGAETARRLMAERTEDGTVASAVVCAVRGSVHPPTPGGQVQVRLAKDALRDVERSRRELSAWLQHHAVRAETIERALLVVSELTTNAVVAASDRAELRVSVARGAVLLEVADDGGSWHPESGLSPVSEGGHGLRVASSLCEDLHVASSAAGTVIRARVGTRSMR